MAKVTVNNNCYSVESLYKWDTGQVLEIHGLSLDVTPQVHFAHEGDNLAIVQPATMDASGVIRAAVPDILLQSTARLCAYICTQQGDEFKTLYKLVIPVTSRAKPADYQPDETAYVYAMLAMDLEVVTLDADAQGYVEKVMDGDKMELRFNVPRGLTGITPQLHVIVHELEAGEPPTATITGTKEDPVLNLGIPAKDSSGGRYPKIWYADIERSSVLGGELCALSSLHGAEEATIDTVRKYDVVISTRDGGVLYVDNVYDNYWGDTTKPCCGFYIQFAGYLPGYPPALTVGFSQGCDFICDGVDDQVEIMAALKALPPLGGKIWFEGGTYNLSGSIRVDTGLGDVEMYCNIDNPARIVGNYVGIVWRGMFYLQNVDRLTVRNLIMENTAHVLMGLEVDTLARGGTVENVSFINIDEALVADEMLGNGVLEVKGCRFTGATVAVGGNFVRVVNCYFENCTTGVNLKNRGVDGMVQNCVFVNVNYAVYVYQNNAIISGNVIQATANPFSLAADKGAVVAGNTFVGVDVIKESGNTYLGNTFIAE